MYANPKHIKKHSYKVSLNDLDQEFLERAARIAGEQPSAFIRELAMEKLREVVQVGQAKFDGELNRRTAG